MLNGKETDANVGGRLSVKKPSVLERIFTSDLWYLFAKLAYLVIMYFYVKYESSRMMAMMDYLSTVPDDPTPYVIVKIFSVVAGMTTFTIVFLAFRAVSRYNKTPR